VCVIRSVLLSSRALIVTAAASLVLSGAVVLTTSAPASAASRAAVLKSAAAYGRSHDYKIGVAVYDTKRNRVYGSGAAKSTFASESVIKVMIATRLILQGRLHGATKKRAYKMITQSDDAIASSFYGSVGGDGLITWIKRHYHVPDLGSPPHRAGWWGNTHITAIGLVKLYAKLKKDKRVGPWLLRTMHHAHQYGSDGTWQFFGLPSATSHAAVKQGWGIDYDDWGRSADFNTTGFVNGDRYAVAILARGPARTYGRAIGAALTSAARRLLPGGRFPDPNPSIQHMTHRHGSATGGQRVTVRGTDLNGASKVYFGGVAGTALHRVSDRELQITTPKHGAGRVPVVIVTSHGNSAGHSYYTYISPPTLTKVTPGSGPAAGGTVVTLTGADFTNVSYVLFGSRRATSIKVLSARTLRAVAPPGTGTVSVRVHTWYGTSGGLPYTYAASGPSSGSRAPAVAPTASPAAPSSTSAAPESGAAPPGR
jgi:hypothetical protein